MIMSEPRLILHVGAPKCGSSALQTNLTRNPDLRDKSGRRLRYVTVRSVGPTYRTVKGAMVARLGQSFPHGYTCWPNFGRHTDSAAILAAVQEAFRVGDKGGWVPILSCEGWINHPHHLAQGLAALGHPPVDVVCFLRPPVEWMNAAWWQWGIWSGRSVDFWMDRMAMPYDFADHLVQWAAIPGVRLHVRRSRPDAVEKFLTLYGADIADRVAANPSAPASLVGFMLRNRRFRETAHSAQSEFVFQRWCPVVPGKRLWGLAPQNVRLMRPVTRHARETLGRLLSEEDCRDVFADPRWTREEPYHAPIRDGRSVLNDIADLPALYDALTEGVRNASGAVGQRMPDLPDRPTGGASIEVWDVTLAKLFDHLIALDARFRRNPVLEIASRLSGGLMQRNV